MFTRWPGKFPAGRTLTGIISLQDWLPTLLAAAGEPNINEKLLQGLTISNRTYRVHLDGINMLPYLTGEAQESPRKAFYYISDDGDLVALRHGDWKLVFMEQRARQLACWFEPFVPLRAPKLFNLRQDPFERADENSNTYWDWFIDHVFLVVPAQGLVMQEPFGVGKKRQSPSLNWPAKLIESLAL